ncbi:MAG: transposase [Rhodoferax sp.]|nr:transposase [Rhodoferax sp.]
MCDAIPIQLRFPTSAGLTIREEFDGGAMSSNFGAILLRGTDLQIGLTSRIASSIDDKRHASYIDHSMVDLLRQRILQTASGYTSTATIPTPCAVIRCSSWLRVALRWMSRSVG